jgi:hypothetical protein
VVFVCNAPFARLGGEPHSLAPGALSGPMIYQPTHPDFRRKSYDKGLEAVKKQPRGTTHSTATVLCFTQGRGCEPVACVGCDDTMVALAPQTQLLITPRS